MRFFKELWRGVVKENPTFVLVLGMCPTLAVSTNGVNALAMGLATSFVLLGSNIIISLIAKITPSQIRIPTYIVVIATFVIIVERFMKAYFPALDKALGIFIPLIVVNCIILGRAEAYASKNPVGLAIADAIGTGLGFTLALLLLGLTREVLGSGKFFGLTLSKSFKPALIFVLPPGAFLVLGLYLALFNYISDLRSGK